MGATYTTTADGFWGSATFDVTPTSAGKAVIKHSIVLPPMSSAAVCSAISFSSQTNGTLGTLSPLGTKCFLTVGTQRFNMSSITGVERTTTTVNTPQGVVA